MSTFTSAQRSAAVDISKKVYFKFLAELFRILSEGCRQEVVTFDVEQMPDAGKAKVRHVGGWARRKVLEKSRRFVWLFSYRANNYNGNTTYISAIEIRQFKLHIIIRYMTNYRGVKLYKG